MKRLHFFYQFIFLMFVALPTALAEVRELQWDDLIPAESKELNAKLSAEQAINPLGHSGSGPGPQPMSPTFSATVPELDGQSVKIPGFIVPLDGDEVSVTSFLLVPYFGACIHVPPPPPNQLVYVEPKQGIPFERLFDPIWIEGKMEISPVESEMGTTSYSMKEARIEVYQY